MIVLEGPAAKVHQLRFPLEPMIELVTNGMPLCGGSSCPHCPRCFSVSALADRLKMPRDRISKWIERGHLTLDAADDAATALGYHPRNIWPDWYERQPFPDVDDDLAVAS